MEQKKTGPIIIIAAFIIIICFPWGIWIFAQKYIDTDNYENREMTALPILTIDNYDSFADDYNSYFCDHVPFRNNYITLNSAIDYFVFHRSSNDYVIPGNNNWLFYNRADDGDPIAHYQGTNLLSNDELYALAKNCIAQRDFLAEQGIEFVIFIAPNKERIYYDKMPDQYGTPATQYRTKQIVEYLKENTDLRIVYPYDELMDARNKVDENIYYKTDTHWNYIGAYVGTSALMKELGIQMPDISLLQIEHLHDTSGDLANMLHLSKALQSTDVEYIVSGYDNHNMQIIQEDFINVFQYSADNADPRKIYVVRDSFSTYMKEYIGSQFTDSYLRHINTYSYDDFASQDPDIFVYETVERYVGNLSTFSVQ